MESWIISALLVWFLIVAVIQKIIDEHEKLQRHNELYQYDLNEFRGRDD